MTVLFSSFTNVTVASHIHLEKESGANICHLAFKFVANEKDDTEYYVLGTVYGKKADQIAEYLEKRKESDKPEPSFFISSNSTILAQVLPKKDNNKFIPDCLLDALQDELDPYYAVPYLKSIDEIFPVAKNIPCSSSVLAVGTVWDRPSVKYLQDGKVVVSGQITTNAGRKKTYSYLRFSAWDKTAATIGDYVEEKSNLTLTGSFKFRAYTNKDDDEKVAVDLSVRNVQLMYTPKQSNNNNNQGYPTSESSFSAEDSTGNEEIPF